MSYIPYHSGLPEPIESPEIVFAPMGAEVAFLAAPKPFFKITLQIHFPATPTRFRHGYDNFHLERTKGLQDAVPSNTREDVEYEVIVIGSGIGGGILADALADQGVHTLLLEAGGLVFPTHITNLPGDWPRLPSHHTVRALSMRT